MLSALDDKGTRRFQFFTSATTLSRKGNCVNLKKWFQYNPLLVEHIDDMLCIGSCSGSTFSAVLPSGPRSVCLRGTLTRI